MYASQNSPENLISIFWVSYVDFDIVNQYIPSRDPWQSIGSADSSIG